MPRKSRYGTSARRWSQTAFWEVTPLGAFLRFTQITFMVICPFARAGPGAPVLAACYGATARHPLLLCSRLILRPESHTGTPTTLHAGIPSVIPSQSATANPQSSPPAIFQSHSATRTPPLRIPKLAGPIFSDLILKPSTFDPRLSTRPSHLKNLHPKPHFSLAICYFLCYHSSGLLFMALATPTRGSQARIHANSFGFCRCATPFRAAARNPRSFCRCKIASHLHILLTLKVPCFQSSSRSFHLTHVVSADIKVGGGGACHP